MIRMIDNLLNRITMYKLVLYYLIGLLGVAVVLSFGRVLNYNPYALLFSTSFLLAACAITNWVFARIYDVPTNAESTYISALILALIISPIQGYGDLWFLLWASVLAMASKYILAFKGTHVFNPVALAIALTYFTINQSASWWIGDARLLPYVLIGGLLIIRKLRRSDLVWSFVLTAFGAVLLGSLFSGTNLFTAWGRLILYSPFAFFAFIMLTEPLTTPPTKKLRIYYGALVGVLFTPLIHLGSFYTTPELAMVIGNVLFYIISPRTRLVLKLKQKARIAPDTYEFVFSAPRKFAFAPGQYMEWTLGMDDSDSRGNRRYFTLASAPTEREIKLGVKFYPRSSAFKETMLAMDRNQEIVATQLAGDFVLPENPKQKIVLIAGGIGITPFRSMIQYMLDTHQRRPVALFYANKTAGEVVYKDLFDRAEKELGIPTIYALTGESSLPVGWRGFTGRITPAAIKTFVLDYRRSVFYISGPIGMVDSFKRTLRMLGVHDSNIKTDYFPGLS